MQFKTFSMLEKDYLELLSLVDGVTEVVELFETESPAQLEWKKNWLERARKLIGEYVKNKKEQTHV
jgi:hypothetical protein